MKKITTAFLCITYLLTWCTHSGAQGMWTKKANFPGSARKNAQSFVIGHYGFIGGGIDNSNVYSDFYKWNQTTNTWTGITNYPGTGYHDSPIAFSIEGKGYFGLGWTGSAAATDLWRYDTATNNWTAMTSLPSTGRDDASVFVLGHKAYIIGGSPGGTPYYNQVWMYDAHANTWKQMNNLPGGNIEGVVTFSIGNHGYIGGGYNGSSNPNSFWEYDSTNDSWTSIASIPVSSGLGGSARAFVIGSKAYVCTGTNGPATTLSDGYVYDTATKIWSTFTNMGANGIERSYAVAFTIGNFGYIGVGLDSIGGYISDFWQYNPSPSGINEVNDNNDVKIYPNPSNNIATLSFNKVKGIVSRVIITDLIGREVRQLRVNETEEKVQIDESMFTSGIYFYKIVDRSDKILSIGRFIVAK